ncbi:MAG: VWA-like domain-containing protein [Eubacteriales bacterium]|nr:VWA-like domain-containing protein [Eubacteriales bacterium]
MSNFEKHEEVNRYAGQTRFERFQTCGQQNKKIAHAFEGWKDSGESQEHHLVYEQFLKTRIRPAAEWLLKEGKIKELRMLRELGWITDALMEELLKKSADPARPDIWMQMLYLRNGRSGSPSVGIKGELYHLFPFLDSVLASVQIIESIEWDPCAFDGKRIFLHPAFIKSAEETGEGCIQLRRAILHMLLHGLLGHLTGESAAADSAWILEDRSIEALIKEECRCRPECRRLLQLQDEKFYIRDDHRIRDRMRTAEKKEIKRRWDYLKQHTGSGGSIGIGSTERGNTPGQKTEELRDLQRSERDYRHFLKRFAVMREEMKPDLESFDYIYYQIGMERYGNIPLLEEPETREGHRLEELVIAIDTSGSCSVEDVRGFLEESYAILCEKENFFARMHVYILQCDCAIQQEAVIHSEQEWEEYCRHLTIEGRAGTDFQPVFRYVEKLRREKKLKNLKGLVYFTDGDGGYPTEKTDYETAFVFLKETEKTKLVPPWAHALVIRGREVYI